MKGRVTKYFEEKGYGFIEDENGESRFFHFSNVKGMDRLHTGSSVEFSPNQNNRGLICLDIDVLASKTPTFISVGNTNIKVSNIKQFGVAYSDKVKAIKTPIFEKNPEYFEKKNKAGKNPFKHLFLPDEFSETGFFTEVRRSEFHTRKIEGNEFRYSYLRYELPYILVRITPKTNEKNHNKRTIIHEDDVKFTYWKYLYITTYQNDNYTFYEYDIDIDETLSELKRVVNR
jgi:cold shock CspA family protein